jgi:hypothetical protein
MAEQVALMMNDQGAHQHQLLKGTVQVITLILDGRRVTTNEVANQLQTNHSSAY